MTEYFAIRRFGTELAAEIDGAAVTVDGDVMAYEDFALLRRRGIDRGEYERLLARRDPGQVHQNQLMAIADRWSGVEISDQTGAERVRDLIVMLRGARDESRLGYEAEARPHLDALEEIRGRWRTITQPLDDALTMLRGKITTWLSAQKALLGQREAPGRAIVLEGGLTCHESPPPATALLRGARPGRAMHLVTRWRAEIVDFNVAAARYRDHPDVRALLVRLASAEARATKGAEVIPGFRIIAEEAAR